jgi:glycosyltransferase involved in cell wall biosynthesis
MRAALKTPEPRQVHPRKIAFVGNSLKMSGVEFSTLNLAASLSPSDWIPIVVVPGEGDLSNRCKTAGVRCEFLPLPRSYSVGVRVGRRTLANPLALAANAVSSLYGAFQIYRFLRRERPDIVVTKGLPAHFFGGLGSVLARVPCVWHVQDRVSERLGIFYPLMLSIAGWMLATHIIADAESIARQLSIAVPPGRISVIWNGVDTREFSPTNDGSRIRREWSLSDHETLIGVVARMTPWKGQHVLLEAFTALSQCNPSLRLVLVGSPMFDNADYFNSLREYVRTRDLEGKVIFAGFRWDLPQIYAALDLYVHTSMEKDSSPLSVVSAMASGKAIVCPRIDGIAELFRNEEDGLLYTPGDAPMLEYQLNRLITDRELATRLGKSARERALQQLGLDIFAEKCQAVFFKCANTRLHKEHE